MKRKFLYALVTAAITAMSASTMAMTAFAEGEAADRTDITFLEYLPLFNSDGTPQ